MPCQGPAPGLLVTPGVSPRRLHPHQAGRLGRWEYQGAWLSRSESGSLPGLGGAPRRAWLPPLEPQASGG